jgi:hypothetical protein
MPTNRQIAKVLGQIDLGSSIAEQDNLLETARVETSTFGDLLNDRVDLVPGTKGSGKSALYRIFVEFLPDHLLQHRKAVVAHGVDRAGDNVFHAFNKEFAELNENDFVNFWCIYIISLAHEQFLKNPRYAAALAACGAEIERFRRTSALAGIPEVKAKKSLRDVLAWTLTGLKLMSPKLKYKPPGDSGEFALTLFGPDVSPPKATTGEPELPRYVDQLRDDLTAILDKCNLNIWFMIDKLDEIFPRRSQVERLALRGLLRSMRMFSSARIRIKIFLRDDMLTEVVGGGEGFVALTHLTARKADTLRWSEEQIISMIAKRLFSNPELVALLSIDKEQLEASLDYRRLALYRVLPEKVYSGARQSTTLRWIYHHTADANGVVTPRDVIFLVTRAIQHQINVATGDPSGISATIISPQAIVYGLEELSKHKASTYLKAEFPHLWPHIEKFVRGKAEYSPAALRKLFGPTWETVATDLMSIGLLAKSRRATGDLFTIPFLYRDGLEITQGRAA